MYSKKMKCYSNNSIFKTKLILENARKRVMLHINWCPQSGKTSLLLSWDT